MNVANTDADGDAAMKDASDTAAAATSTTKEKKTKEKPKIVTKGDILKEIAQLLIDAGAKTDLVSDNGERALEVAIIHCNWTMVRFLLERKPALLLPQNATTKHYEAKNVLHLLAPRLMTLNPAGRLSAGMDPISLVKLLAECPDYPLLFGADQIDHRGLTPIHSFMESFCRYKLKTDYYGRYDEAEEQRARQSFVELFDLLLTQAGGDGAIDILTQQVAKRALVMRDRKTTKSKDKDEEDEEEVDEYGKPIEVWLHLLLFSSFSRFPPLLSSFICHFVVSLAGRRAFISLKP